MVIFLAHDVYISYSIEDKAIANKVCSRLEGNNIRCWIHSRDLPTSRSWGESVVKAINESEIFILIFSSNSNESTQVINELAMAARNGIMTIPFRVEDVFPSARMEYITSRTHCLDALTPPLEEHIDRLIQIINTILDRN